MPRLALTSPASRLLLLSGPMGAGKTTLGRAIANATGVEFVDLDELVEARAGASIASLFARGEAVFRAVERDALLALLAHPGRRVVALGGGALVDASCRRVALEEACVVTLVAPVHELSVRLARDGRTRPLLVGHDLVERLHGLVVARQAAYAEAHASIDTSSAPLEVLAGRLLRVWAEPSLVVALGASAYPVRLTDDPAGAVAEAMGVLAATRGTPVGGCFAVSDERVASAWGSWFEQGLGERGVRSVLATFPEGEASKRLSTIEALAERAVAAGVDRSWVVVGLGGGVSTDLAGLLASLLGRGLPWIAVPTSVLGAADASVGGKTAVDLASGKNLLGTFHQPRAVFIASTCLPTEPPRSQRAGLAEVVKSAALSSAEWLEELSHVHHSSLQDGGFLGQQALRAAAVKAPLVEQDERDEGDRALLNLGHTVGHALEAAGGFAAWLHGEAVAMGLVLEARATEQLGLSEQGTAAALERALAACGLPTSAPSSLVREALPLLARDKKRAGARVRLPYLVRPGQASLAWVNLNVLSGALMTQGDSPAPSARG